MRSRLSVWYGLAGLACGLNSGMVRAQQQCATALTFTPVSQPNRIEWSKFPTFSLPFPVVYGGPRLGDTQASPLKHGFSQLGQIADSEAARTTTAQRAAIYYGVAYGLGQPWEQIESPWNNDLTAYRAQWENWLIGVSGGQKNATGQYVMPISRLVIDIERILETDTQILRIKTNSLVPQQYRNLSDAAFLMAYKQAIRNLYAEAARYIRQRSDLSNVSLSGYADTPILNNALNITTFSWTDWTTNLNRVNYLVKDSTESRVGGPYYEQLTTMAPSAYYYYDYPNPFARDYLPYLLFQIEVNRAWSDKPVVPFIGLRYHPSSNSYPGFVQPFMAEATAIFPVFSGAAGLWLWDDPTLENSRSDVYSAYEYFTHGLYRLSQFSDMFQGGYERVIEAPARDLMEKQLPVWRGIVKGNNILIAAHNPYAAEGQPTSLLVTYKNWQQRIQLTGREVYLCRFDMSVVTANEPATPTVNVFPNPTSTSLTVSFGQLPTSPTRLTLVNATGQTVGQWPVSTATSTVNVATLPAGAYILRITTDTGQQTHKIMLNR